MTSRPRADLAEFYRGRRVLITGHTGFKGAWLSLWLAEMGAEVIGFALPPDQGPDNLFERAAVGARMTSVLGDLRDTAAVAKVIERHRPEVIIHNGAQALVRRSYRDPVETYATNVLGTAHVLDAARRAECVRSIVVVTSDKCYENREWLWAYREEDVLGGRDPYSSSKACAELVCAAFRHSFFSRDGAAGLATVRAGNVIGGGDWADDRLVPDIMRAIASGTAVVLRHPQATRPWQHVLDPLRGYLLLAIRLAEDPVAFGSAWNFGPGGEPITVSELARQMIAAMGAGSIEVRQDAAQPHEAHSLQVDPAKAAARLGWRALLEPEQAVAWTAAWYREYLRDRSSARELTMAQIKDYTRLTQDVAAAATTKQSGVPA